MEANNQSRFTVPQFPESYWLHSRTRSHSEPLKEDTQVDVAVIGGGITGITTAYLLVKEGYKVALIEASTLMNGTTGHTTAKITAQHDLIYDEFIQHFGQERAKLYYEANDGALNFIKQTIEQHDIACELTPDTAYLYGTSHQDATKIEKEYHAYQKLGIKGELVNKMPLDISVTAALSMANQAHFHPINYLNSLIKSFLNEGGVIYEHTTAVDIEQGKPNKIVTRNGQKISCSFALICSHFPFYDGLGFYFTRMYAERSYLLAIKPQKSFDKGMYLSVSEPKRSIRKVNIDGESHIIIGGERHKTGQGINTMKHYEALESFANTTFGIQKYAYRWSAQDLTTLDKLPYIGQLTSSHPTIFVATGYRKWGMTNGTAAAHLLKDLVMQNDSPYKELFAPTRFYTDPSLKHFIVENTNVAGELIKGKFDLKHKHLSELDQGEGAIVIVDGQRAGAYKDEHNEIHIVDTTCQHLGCEVEWNDGDKSWDCPCHGSRYSYDGDVLEGPTKKPLKKLKVMKRNENIN